MTDKAESLASVFWLGGESFGAKSTISLIAAELAQQPGNSPVDVDPLYRPYLITTNIYAKAGMTNRVEAATCAAKHGGQTGVRSPHRWLYLQQELVLMSSTITRKRILTAANSFTETSRMLCSLSSWKQSNSDVAQISPARDCEHPDESLCSRHRQALSRRCLLAPFRLRKATHSCCFCALLICPKSTIRRSRITALCGRRCSCWHR